MRPTLDEGKAIDHLDAKAWKVARGAVMGSGSICQACVAGATLLAWWRHKPRGVGNGGAGSGQSCRSWAAHMAVPLDHRQAIVRARLSRQGGALSQRFPVRGLVGRNRAPVLWIGRSPAAGLSDGFELVGFEPQACGT